MQTLVKLIIFLLIFSTSAFSKKFDLGFYTGFKSVTSKTNSVSSTQSVLPVGSFLHYLIPVGSMTAGVGVFAEYVNYEKDYFEGLVDFGRVSTGIDAKLVFIDQKQLILYGRAGLGLLSSKGSLVSVGESYHLLVGVGLKNIFNKMTLMAEGGMTGGSIDSVSLLGIQLNVGLIMPISLFK